MMMKTHFRLFGTTLLAIMALSVRPAFAQQATERYIPIGQSPGLSGEYNWMGEIISVDPQARTVTIRNQRGERTVQITDTTHIWVDRSSMRQVSTTGSMTDLIVGRRAEIKYVDYAHPEVAAWIKVAGR